MGAIIEGILFIGSVLADVGMNAYNQYEQGKETKHEHSEEAEQKEINRRERTVSSNLAAYKQLQKGGKL